MRFWFFGDGGKTFIATAECATEKAASRLALEYNREPGPLGYVDLITDNQAPENAGLRLVVDKPVREPRSRDD